jgi:short-subunit dehydrogenase
MSFKGKTYWIVGASEGLGLSLARLLRAEGAEVILSARNSDRLSELEAEIGGARGVAMDVTDEASVSGAVAEIGEVDGMVYSVGLYDPMAAQDWDAERALSIAEANYMGALRVLGAIVPEMAARDDGHIVLVGSLAGFSGLPGAIGYASSKAALMHLAEDMHADLHRSGVRVQRVNPGFIRTRLTAKNEFTMPQIMEPEDAAQHVLRAMRSGRFSTSFPKPFAWLFTGAKFLPRRLFLKLMGA